MAPSGRPPFVIPQLDYPDVSAGMDRRVQSGRSVVAAKAGTHLSARPYGKYGVPLSRE